MQRGRDNARTPIQWNNREYGGFSTSEPWIPVNENYKYINAEQCLEDKNSIFYHYKKLIEIRKSSDTIIYGNYRLLCDEDKNIFAYIRELDGEKILVVCNFYGENVEFNFSENVGDIEILLSNYIDSSKNIEVLSLRPYESIMYKL